MIPAAVNPRARRRIQTEIGVPFGEAPAVRREEERQVTEGGRGGAEQPVEVELTRGGGEQVAPPHHLGDPHRGIVRNHRQLVGKDPVRTAEDKVPAFPREILAAAAIVPVEKGDLLIRHDQPQRGVPQQDAPADLLLAQIAAGAGVDHLPVGSMGRARRVELCAGAKAGINQPLPAQPGEDLLVERAAETLLIGGMGPRSTAAALIPIQSQKIEIPLELIGVFPL